MITSKHGQNILFGKLGFREIRVKVISRVISNKFILFMIYFIINNHTTHGKKRFKFWLDTGLNWTKTLKRAQL